MVVVEARVGLMDAINLQQECKYLMALLCRTRYAGYLVHRSSC